ncbi:MAG: hypothetical protein HQK96_19990 [Nitrospirae bacterium]|nr:hypothetical protein [Nitrospirota bacterium]
MFERDSTILKDLSIEKTYLSRYKPLDTYETIGLIPVLEEPDNKDLLTYLLGDRMGANNKAFPFNWIKNHISDTNKKMQPRSILSLFAHAAKKQQIDRKTTDYVIRPYNMEQAIMEVSEQRVSDIQEEYPDLKDIFTSLKDRVERFPVYENNLLLAINDIKKDQNAREIINKLLNIGVLYKYKFRKVKDEQRYHIPDLYLPGMGLKRGGHGGIQIT